MELSLAWVTYGISTSIVQQTMVDRVPFKIAIFHFCLREFISMKIVLEALKRQVLKTKFAENFIDK